MTFEIKWILLAEAVAQNGDGVLSAIGIGQNVALAYSLPVRTKRALVVRVESTEAELPGDQMVVEFSVVAPSGKTIVAQNAQAPIGPPKFTEFPWTAHIPAELGMTLTEFGTHVVRAAVTIGSEAHEATLPLHVLQADEALPVLLGDGGASAESEPVEADSSARGIRADDLPRDRGSTSAL
jgi:hypothetical protein